MTAAWQLFEWLTVVQRETKENSPLSLHHGDPEMNVLDLEN